jgi:hypothetical protein
VHVIVSLLLSHFTAFIGIGGTWISWIIFLYCFSANAFYLLRSLKYVLLPDQSGQGMGNAAAGYTTVAKGQKNRRTQFLFVYSYVVQFGFMMWLSRV